MQAKTVLTGPLRALCSPSDSQLTDRMAENRRDIMPLVRRINKNDTGFSLELNGSPGLKPKVERIIELERQCCVGALQFDLREHTQDDGLTLEVKGINLPLGTLENLFNEIKGPSDTSTQGPRLRRVLRSGGIGIVGALVVFCGIPLGLAALLGASAASYSTKLDNLALVFGGAAWWYQTHRSTIQKAGGQKADCGC